MSETPQSQVPQPGAAAPGAAAPGAAAPATGGTSGLAITAFVLSLLFFIPLAPLVGGVLGIVGTARVREGQGGRGLAIAAIPVGFCCFLFIQLSMMAAVAIPSFIKYTRKAKTVEATENLDQLRIGAAAFARADHHSDTGDLLPRRFPVGDSGWVPAAGCCGGAEPRCAPQPGPWQAEPWPSLHFAVTDPHYYQYRYTSDGERLVVQARGDLDCDGTYSTFQIEGALRDGEPTFGELAVANEIE